MMQMACDPALTTMIEKRSYPGYGVFEEPRTARILRIIGYLGRRAHDDGNYAAAADAYELLSAFSVAGVHPGIATARLVGLGYLGDWEPLLNGLSPTDNFAHLAAYNVVVKWTPGPYTPRWSEDLEAIARWIDRRLSMIRDMDPSVRSTLQEIKQGIETRLAHYVLAGPAETGHR
jgi:hypothetical protein